MGRKRLSVPASRPSLYGESSVVGHSAPYRGNGRAKKRVSSSHQWLSLLSYTELQDRECRVVLHTLRIWCHIWREAREAYLKERRISHAPTISTNDGDGPTNDA